MPSGKITFARASAEELISAPEVLCGTPRLTVPPSGRSDCVVSGARAIVGAKGTRLQPSTPTGV